MLTACRRVDEEKKRGAVETCPLLLEGVVLEVVCMKRFGEGNLAC